MLKKLLLLSTLLLGLFTVQAQETWYLEDFESLGVMGPQKPEDWTISQTTGLVPQNTFKPAIGQGVDASNAFSAQMNNTTVEYWFYTQSVAFGTQPVVEFQYKTAGVVGAAPENCMGLEIAVSTDGETWTAVKTVAAADFVSSAAYAPMRAVLAESYANSTGYVRIKATPAEDAGTVNFYVDNFGVGTQAESVANDLMVQGELSGPAMPTVNTEAEYTFTVFNNGTASQAAYGVQLLNGTRTLLASENITTAIEAGASAQHTLKYTPTQAGADKLYAVVVLAGDENPANDTAALDIEVQAAGNTVVEVGKGTMLTHGQPFAFYDLTSIALAIYTPEELNGINGTISALMFEGKFTTEMTFATQVFIGETDVESIDPLSDELFVDPATLTKVFDGDMTFPEGDHQSIRFNFTQPFAYSGGRNLAVYTFSSIAADAVLSDLDKNRFYATSTMGGANVAAASSGENIDPMQPNKAGGSPKFQRPDIKFFFSSVSDEKYNLAFTVKDTDGKALTGAVITLNGEKQEAGQYVFEDLPARLYAYVVEKEGFIQARGSLRLSKDTTVAVTLTHMVDYPGLSGFLFEDFENISQGKRPLNWTGSFYVDEEGGKRDGHRLTHSFWLYDGSRDIMTNPIFMGSDPVFEFDYRVMAFEPYPDAAFSGENMTWAVEVSDNFGITWDILYVEDYGQHVSGIPYEPFSLDVSAYAGKICQFKITVNRNAAMPDEFYFDIDNLKIGTQLEKDLALVSKIEGMRVPEAGAKTAYTVCVRNEGTAAAENYSLKFYDGETEIGSVPGTKIEGGAFAKLTFEYTFAEAGEHTLKAVCEMEDDELIINNASSELYVSVQPEGVRSSIVEAYEGEDMSWYAPLSMYENYSLSWLLYNKKDLTLAENDNISGMAFRTKFERATDRMHLVIYMGETGNNSLYQWVPAPTSLTKVFDGVASINDLDGGNLVINFDRTYRYTGNKNIVVAVYTEVTRPLSYEVECGFYGYYSLDEVSVINFRDNNPIDLSATPSQEDVGKNALFTKPSTIFLLNDNVSYYSVNFEVTDQNGDEVKNATITFNGTVLRAGQHKVENVPDGTYTYTVSLDYETVNGSVTVNGADVTEKVQLQHVANENLTENMIRIYPNPTTDKLHIDVVEGAKEINLYDISGRPVRKLNRVPAGVIEMDLSDCHSGIYLLMIDGKAFKISKR